MGVAQKSTEGGPFERENALRQLFQSNRDMPTKRAERGWTTLR